MTAQFAAESIVNHWRLLGLPKYAQFDNDTIFQGRRRWPDTYGRVIGMCPSLDVIPVFAPPRETGFQAAIENHNGRWQAKVWLRSKHPSLPALLHRSDWSMAEALGKPLAGSVVVLCRTDPVDPL